MNTPTKSTDIIKVPDTQAILAQWNKDIKKLVVKYKDFESSNKSELNSAKKEINTVVKEVQETGLNTRRIFNNISKSIKDIEDETIGPISPIFEIIKTKHKEVLEQEKREKREQLLPLRLEELSTVGVEESDDLKETILSMEDKDYVVFLQDKQQEHFDRIQQEQEQAQARMQEEIRKEKLAMRKPLVEEAGVYMSDSEMIDLDSSEFTALLNERKNARLEREKAQGVQTHQPAPQSVPEQENIQPEKTPTVQAQAVQAPPQDKSKAKAFFEKHGVTKADIESGEYKLVPVGDGMTWTLYKRVDVLVSK